MKPLTFTSILTLVILLFVAQVPSKVVPVAEHYEGGKEAMYKFINANIIYPPMAKRNRMQGECIIAFVLNEDGTTSGHKIVKNIGGGCGEEALRVSKLLKFRQPGYKMQTNIPVIFKL